MAKEYADLWNPWMKREDALKLGDLEVRMIRSYGATSTHAAIQKMMQIKRLMTHDTSRSNGD